MKIYGRESAKGDFPGAKLENAKKNSPKIFFGDYEKTFSLKNEFRIVKRGRLIKWSIMHIFNEAGPPWSNLSEILG